MLDASSKIEGKVYYIGTQIGKNVKIIGPAIVAENELGKL